MKKLLLILLLFPIVIVAQPSELSIFNNLVAKTWAADGNWGDGSKFKQQITFNYSLDSTIVTANAIGFIDKAQTKLGPRNHGIRQYNKAANNIRFWEFDVFGGLTEGVVYGEGKNILYQYKYGDTTITDMWQYVDDNTYNFIVGNYKDGTWQQTYLKTQFKVVKSK